MDHDIIFDHSEENGLYNNVVQTYLGVWEQANEMCIDFHDNHFRAEEAFALKMLGCQQENMAANNHPFDVKDKQRKVQAGMVERNYKASSSRVREHEGCLRTFALSIIHIHCVCEI